MSGRPASRDIDQRELGRLIRRSQVLDASLKRHWLGVLPYLTPSDRKRLADILAPEQSQTRREPT